MMGKPTIVLYARNAAYGNAPGLLQALRLSERFAPVGLVVADEDAYGFHRCRGVTVASAAPRSARRLLWRADALWLCGAVSWSYLRRTLRDLGIAPRWSRKLVFLSDTYFMIHPWRAWTALKEAGFAEPFFAMPDLMRFCPSGTPLYQPEPPLESVADDCRIVVGHSPGQRYPTRMGKKGTDAILRVVKSLQDHFEFEFDLMTGLSNADCLQLKRRCHIFIDKVVDHTGGLGKSGLEALACGCAVVSSMQHTDAGDYPPPPVVPAATEDELWKAMMPLLTNASARDAARAAAREWRHNLSYEATARRIDKALSNG